MNPSVNQEREKLLDNIFAGCFLSDTNIFGSSFNIVNIQVGKLIILGFGFPHRRFSLWQIVIVLLFV